MCKFWLIRPFPSNNDRLSNFKSENIIGIGWSELPSLLGKDKNEIRESLDTVYNFSSQELGAALATINIFTNQISIDDIVLLPYNDDVYFAKITSNYFHNSAKIADGYPHQREVAFIKGPISRTMLSNELRSSLRAPRTAADLNHHSAWLNNFLFEDDEAHIQSSDFIEVSYPLRPNLNCMLSIPNNITRSEALRLSEFVKTIFFE